MLMFVLVGGKEADNCHFKLCFSGYRSGTLDTVIVYSEETGSFLHLARLFPKENYISGIFDLSAIPGIPKLMNGKKNENIYHLIKLNPG